MSKRMADSVNVSSLPPGMDAYAGYVNGWYNDYAAIVAAHPGVPVIGITVRLVNIGECIDIEYGDGTPPDAPWFIIDRTVNGVWRPIVYCSKSDLPAVVGQCNNLKINRGSYRLWSAHYGDGQHICGPYTCGSPIQADATQWIDHGPWDESLCPDWFFAPAPPAPLPPVVPPPTQSAPIAIPNSGGLMNVDWSTTTGTDGTAYVSLNVPAGCTKIVSCSADVLDAAANVPPRHDADLDQTDPAGPRDASGVVVQPCVGAQAAGKQRVRLAGGAPQHFYTGHAIFAP